ncbi:site-specific integrase [Luteitalea sp. TBR-22]|uniref:tyrosine-type recombinase/integrase n=1 Tax=Luteitalea sp. TBR-22 TaxID=2802971 RepID=UPI001EF5E53A|nr:site-specific integrase [Luteitalea sp. TBR-22]
MLVDDIVQDVINDYVANGKRTRAEVERRWKLHLKPAFGGRRVSSLTTADLRAYVAKRQAEVRADEGDETAEAIPGAKAATVNRELAILKRGLRLALQAGKVQQVPHVPMLRERNVRTGFFERDQFESVRAHLPEEIRPLVTFAYCTGWRVPSEVRPLEWRQVDWQAGTVRLDVGATKNDEGRTFPFDVLPELRKVLEDQRAEADRLQRKGVLCPFVFHRDGQPIRSFRGAWAKACKAAGVPGRIPHDFRRTAVRNLVRAGVPERVAMQLTGHKTRSVFDRYDIVNEADLRGAVARLAASGATANRQRIITSGKRKA